MYLPEHRQSKYFPVPVQVIFALPVLLLAGCLYTGGVENPVARKFNWFSYVAGDDIKRACADGAPAQYRFVYNAHWYEQVRAYDLRRSATGEGAMLWTHVFTGGGGVDITGLNLSDPTRPWGGASAQTRLDEGRYLELIRAVEASGFGAPAPAGLRLQSPEFYWTMAACAGGRFHFNAWRHPSERFAAITFDKLLFAADTTGVRVNPPRPIDRALEKANIERADGYWFELMVGRDGLAGRLPPI